MPVPNSEAVVCGLIVADIIGRPIDLANPPPRGSLQLLQEIKLFTGGNVCNVGIALAKFGVRVAAIGRVGQDGAGDFVRAELKRNHVDCRGVRLEPRAQTSATVVCVDGSGERTFFHVLGANSEVSAADLLHNLPLLRRAKILVVGYYGMLPSLEPLLPRVLERIKLKTQTRKRPDGIQIALDTGGSALQSSQLSHLGECLKHVDYFIPSHDEASALTGREDPLEILDALQFAIPNWETSVPTVLGVKRGAQGCVLREYLEGVIHEHVVSSFPVKRVMDTTGAGDCFLAGFVAARLRGFSVVQAGRFGNATGASCIQALGATAGIRSFAETKKNFGV